MTQKTSLEEAADRRNRNLIGGIATSVLSRGAGFIAPIILIPFALSTLGTPTYGFWSAAIALTSMAMFGDLGLGNGLMTRLGVCYAEDNWPRARRLISSALVLTTGAGLVLSSVAVFAIFATGLPAWLDSKGEISPSTAESILLVVFLAFIVNIPLSLITRIQYAYQRVAYSNLWTAGASVASLAAFVVADASGSTPLACIAAAAFAVPLMSALNLATYLLGIERRLRPRIEPFDKGSVTDLLRIGSAFFAISILTTLAMNVDTILVTRILGLQETASFSVAWRLISAVGVMVSLINLPLWPANSEALARGDIAWVLRATKRMALFSAFAAATLGTVIVLCGQWAISHWISQEGVTLSTGLLAAFALWMVVLSVASPWFMIQNGAGVLRPQLIGWIGYLILAVPLKIALINLWGMVGAPIAGTVVYCICIGPAIWVGVRVALRAPDDPQN